MINLKSVYIVCRVVVVVARLTSNRLEMSGTRVRT